MTTGDVLAALCRRWYLTVLGVIVTGVVVSALLLRPGVYATRVQVLLLAPASPSEPSGLVHTSDSLISMAGLLERTVNAGVAEQPALTTDDVDLAGTGVREGTQIRLPNVGGQYGYNFTSPILSVQVVGPQAQEVVRARTKAVERILDTLRRMQEDDGIRGRAMITARVVPDAAPVTYQAGHAVRAAAAAIILGLAITVVLTCSFDGRLARRRLSPEAGERTLRARAPAS